MTAQGEKFCLRWNDFEKNISSSFRELKEDKDFFDVTIACDDNQIQGHKVILSACSPFFPISPEKESSSTSSSVPERSQV